MKKVIILLTIVFACTFTQAQENEKSILGYFEDSSYWVNMPNEFNNDPDTSKRFGTIFFLIPNGFNFNDAPAVIYSTVFKNKTVNSAIEEDVKRFKDEAPKLTVSKTEYFKSKAGNSIAVKEFINPSSRQQPYESIAYIQEDSHVVVIVVSAFSKANYEYVVPMFKKMLESYESAKIKVQKHNNTKEPIILNVMQ